MNIQIEVQSVAITEKSKKIESGWTFGRADEMQLFFEFFDSGSVEASHLVSNAVPPTE